MGRIWLRTLVPTPIPEACIEGFSFIGLSGKYGQVEERHGRHWTCSFPSFKAPPSDPKEMECDRVVEESRDPAFISKGYESQVPDGFVASYSGIAGNGSN